MLDATRTLLSGCLFECPLTTGAIDCPTTENDRTPTSRRSMSTLTLNTTSLLSRHKNKITLGVQD